MDTSSPHHTVMHASGQGGSQNAHGITTPGSGSMPLDILTYSNIVSSFTLYIQSGKAFICWCKPCECLMLLLPHECSLHYTITGVKVGDLLHLLCEVFC